MDFEGEEDEDPNRRDDHSDAGFFNDYIQSVEEEEDLAPAPSRRSRTDESDEDEEEEETEKTPKRRRFRKVNPPVLVYGSPDLPKKPVNKPSAEKVGRVKTAASRNTGRKS